MAVVELQLKEFTVPHGFTEIIIILPPAPINSTVCLIMLHLKLISKSLPLWAGFILSLCSSPAHLSHLTLSSCISPSVCDYLYSCQNDGLDVDSKLLKNIPTKWPHGRRFRKCKAESRSHGNKIWPFFGSSSVFTTKHNQKSSDPDGSVVFFSTAN